MRTGKLGVTTPTETLYYFDIIYYKFQVQFARKVFSEKIDIYETFKSGSVKKIQLMQPDGKWYTAWETDTVQLLKEKRVFSPTLKVRYNDCTKYLHKQLFLWL